MVTKKATKTPAKKVKASDDEVVGEVELSESFTPQDIDNIIPLVESHQPKHYEYDIAAPASLIPMIADAWDAVKGEGDANFATCAPNFRDTLMAHGVDAVRSGIAQEGDTNLALFEREIIRIK